MRRLDRHLLSGFLVSALVTGAALFCLFVLIDCFQHFDAFLKSSRDRGESMGRVILAFYLHQLPLTASFLAPVVACAAAGAAATRLQRDHETLVLTCSGISLQRAGLPLLAGAALFGTLMAADQELVIPRVSRSVAANENAALGHDTQQKVWDIFRVDLDRRAVQIQVYNRAEHRLENVTITQVDERGLKRRVIYAERATWGVDDAGEPTLELSRGIEYAYPEGDTLGAVPREFGERGLRMRTRLTETSLLERGLNPLLMDTRELEAHLRALPQERRASSVRRLETALWARLPDCLAPLVLAVLGVALVFRQETVNYAWGLGLGLSGWIAYWALSEVARVLSAQVLPPPLAAWAPLACLGTAGTWLYLTMRS